MVGNTSHGLAKDLETKSRTKKRCRKHWDSQKQRKKVLAERVVLTFEFSMTASIQSKYDASLTA